MKFTELEMIIHKSIDRESYTVHLRTDGVVHVHFKPNTLITKELQDSLEEDYKMITSEKRPFIFTGGEFVSITKEARLNAIAMEPRVPIGCNAIIVKNLAQRIIADYYYKFNKPLQPYKVFKNFDQGLAWVKSSFEIPEVA
jgi:hypothetical protein